MKKEYPKVLILLPGISFSPIGGYKVILEYANRLSIDGYNVTIAYAGFIYRDFRNKSFREKLSIIKRLLVGPKKVSARRWFNLHQNIKEIYPLTLNYKKNLKADIYIATACLTAKYVNQYPHGKKFYFIQDYENWSMTDNELIQTYLFPLKKIVISQWLKKIIDSCSDSCVVVPNGFDAKEYYVSIPIKNKDKMSISMLYNSRPAKDVNTTIEALSKVHEKYDIRVYAFGAEYPKTILPNWIKFIYAPSHEKHLEINNKSSIYVASSYSEGWGLTIGEAMMCGQAVVCTDANGFLEMAIHERNALVSPAKDAHLLASNIMRLLEDDFLRCRLAEQGVKDIEKFNIESSYLSFRNVIEEIA